MSFDTRLAKSNVKKKTCFVINKAVLELKSTVCLKILEKISFNIALEASYVYISWVDT